MAKRRGPKGGHTTTTPGGLVRKGFIITPEQAEELRERAHRERRSESELVREALQDFLFAEDDGAIGR